jgi:periplasmic protein TonB
MPTSASRRLWKRRLAVAVVSIGALSFIGLISATLLKPSPADHHKIQQVVVLRAVAPPPPKPPEKPPDPPKREEVKLDQPKPQDEPKPADQEPPPPGPLGVDANGTGPGDGFGLAARPGGRDITLGGSGNGGAGFGYTTFASATARFIAQELARDDRLRSTNYRVEVRVWLSRSGRVDHCELVRGTGDPELDRKIRDGLTQLGSLRQSVPEGLPQPLRIRVTSSDA